MMHLQAGARYGWVRGSMDAVVGGDVPRVIDYKYATWREGAEDAYDIQLTSYCLALMKSLNTESAVGELWFLKSPLKIVRREYTLREAEESLHRLLNRYIDAL